jgi:hypothetical protein
MTEDAEIVAESIVRTTHTAYEGADTLSKKAKSMCQRIYTLFTRHPHNHQMSYAGHALRALRMAARMGKGAVGLCIHSVFPFLCEKTGTNTVDRLHAEIHAHDSELKQD